MTDQDIKSTLKGKLQHYEVPATDPYEWDELDRKLENKRFFRFAYNRFNIYYLCFIAAYGLVTTGLTALYVQEHYVNNVHQPVSLAPFDTSGRIEQSGQYGADQAATADGVRSLPQNTKSQNHVLSKGVEKPQAGQTSGAATAPKGDAIPLVATAIDTLKVVHEKPAQELNTKKPPQSLTVISKQDTIRKYDTVYVQRKKRFRIK